MLFYYWVLLLLLLDLVLCCLHSWILFYFLNSVQFSHSVISDSLWPHEPQHARPPCPSPWVYLNSCPLSQWCHPTISSSVISFSSCPQSFPESGSFPRSQFFTSGGQSTGVSALTSVLPMNTQDWSALEWTSWSLQSKGLSRVFSNTTVKASILLCSAFSIVQLSHPYMTTGKTIALTRWTFVGKVMSLLFNMLSRLIIAFLPRNKCLLISWISHYLQWFWSPKKQSLTLFPPFPHLFPMKWWDQMPRSSFPECWA